MQSIAKEGVSWSVRHSVCLSVMIIGSAKMVEPIAMPFQMLSWWVQGTMYYVLDGLHIGTTWQIQLNHLCVATMHPYVKSFWPLVYKY